MPLPRCPACGTLIFPSARDGGDTSPLCEDCQERARKTGHAGPSLRFATAEVREEVIEPSGPFLLPQAMPPAEVLEHLQSRAPILAPSTPEVVVVEPSGPFIMPGAPAPVALEETPARHEQEVEVVEPSGPFLAPSTDEAAPPPVSFEEAVTSPVVGIAHSATRHVPMTDPEAPSVVIEPELAGRRVEATLDVRRDRRDDSARELRRELRDALTPTPRVQMAWTALALAFAAGMLAGAALAVAVIKL